MEKTEGIKKDPLAMKDLYDKQKAADDEAGYIDNEMVSNQLDIMCLAKDTQIVEFNQENLSKKIPSLYLIGLIENQYPTLVTKTNEITMDTLVHILKEGAEAN
jgi:hypothetical protein